MKVIDVIPPKKVGDTIIAYRCDTYSTYCTFAARLSGISVFRVDHDFLDITKNESTYIVCDKEGEVHNCRNYSEAVIKLYELMGTPLLPHEVNMITENNLLNFGAPLKWHP